MRCHPVSGHLALLLVLACVDQAVGAELLLPRYDPAKVIENETRNCAQCHERSVEAWSNSAHKSTYDELHLRDRAREILTKMGGDRSVRKYRTCAQCHYTQVVREGDSKPKAVMGVSCQRCHGPALDWADIHQDIKQYPDLHERLDMSHVRGLRSRASFYDMAHTCYKCHTVPKEKLVNIGGHHAGSEGYELVEWMYGEVRHNFLQMPERGINREPGIEKRRVVYVLGQALEIEFGLRRLAVATREGPFLDAIEARLQSSYSRLKALQLGLPEIDGILAEVPGNEGAGVRPDRRKRAQRRKAAERVCQLARAFEEKQGVYANRLVKVDPFLPVTYHGDVFQ